MELTEDDVLEILKLFEQSNFDFLQLQHGERKITVSKAGYVPVSVDASAASAQPVTRTAPAPTAAHELFKAEVIAVGDGLVPVTAPMVGKFYAAPSPSDPPYVQVGAEVTVDATLGLIEVMKVFTSIKTEVAGVVEQILVSNGQFVEYGQTLFLIRPEQSSGEKDAA